MLKTVHLCIVLVSLILIPSVSNAQNNSLTDLFGRIVGKDSEAEDKVHVDKAIDAALATPSRTAKWRNPATGHNGTVSIINRFEDKDGYDCRNYRRITRTAKSEIVHEGVLCKQIFGWVNPSESLVSRKAIAPDTGTPPQAGTLAPEQPASAQVPSGAKSGPVVMQTQRYLSELGYEPGPVDGFYGGRTGNAIRSYQRDQGLGIDGQATPGLVESLQQTIANQQAGSAPRTAASAPPVSAAAPPRPEPEPMTPQAAASPQAAMPARPTPAPAQPATIDKALASQAGSAPSPAASASPLPPLTQPPPSAAAPKTQMAAPPVTATEAAKPPSEAMSPSEITRAIADQLAPKTEKATEVGAAGTGTNEPGPLDDWTAFFIYRKLAGAPVDFEKIAATFDRVKRANNFDRPDVLAEETERLKAAYQAADPSRPFSLRVASSLKYEHGKSRFEDQLFVPGTFVYFTPVKGGVLARQYQHRMAFANGESVRFIPMARTEAEPIDKMGREGAFTAIMTAKIIGVGDPHGLVDSEKTLRAEILNLRRVYRNHTTPNAAEQTVALPDTLVPYTPGMDPENRDAKAFNIVGLKPGIDLDAALKKIEGEFGKTAPIGLWKGDDPRLKKGISHNSNGCFSFGNKVAEIGSICIRAYPDEKGVVRKIVVEQIVEGTEWDGIRSALIDKYGAVSESALKANNKYFGWGPKVAKSITMDEQLAPQRALSASLSVMQSATARSTNSTQASTNLRIRLIDPDWAGPPEAPKPVAEKKGPRL